MTFQLNMNPNMDAVKAKERRYIQQLEHCKDLVNGCKLQLVHKKMMNETAILEYLEKLMQKEECKLNQYLRTASKLHLSIHSNSKQETSYKMEAEINILETAIKDYHHEMNNDNVLFSTLSAEWLESSIDLQQKLSDSQRENASLQSQLESLQNGNTDTIRIKPDELELLQSQRDALKQKVQSLQCTLNETQKYMQKELEPQIVAEKQKNDDLKQAMIRIHDQCTERLDDIESVFKSSTPILMEMDSHYQSSLSHSQGDHDERVNASIDIMDRMSGFQERLNAVLLDHKQFVIQQNKLKKEMKKETAKLLKEMESRNTENERLRESEIKTLIQETRDNLKREYGEYNSYCDQKVDDIKNQCLKYRENVLQESKQQIKDKREHFETAKDLMRKRYEDEISSLRALHNKKNQRMLNEVEELQRKLVEQKGKQEMEISDRVEILQQQYEEKVAMKERQIADRMKVLEMRYELKVDDLAKKHEEKMQTERTQFRMQQELMQNEIENLTNNFKKEIQILKRFKPHHIVHVPLGDGKGMKDGGSYGSQLLQYIDDANGQ